MVREYSVLKSVVVWGRGYHPITHWWVVHPVSMGRVRSGWLSKFQCNPELFRVIPEQSGQTVLFQEVSEWSGHHWKPLTGCPTAWTVQLMS